MWWPHLEESGQVSQVSGPPAQTLAGKEGGSEGVCADEGLPDPEWTVSPLITCVSQRKR